MTSHAGRGDVVLAPPRLSQTLAAISGTVYTVDPRTFYTHALAGQPAARAGRLECLRAPLHALVTSDGGGAA